MGGADWGETQFTHVPAAGGPCAAALRLSVRERQVRVAPTAFRVGIEILFSQEAERPLRLRSGRWGLRAGADGLLRRRRCAAVVGGRCGIACSADPIWAGFPWGS